MHDDPIIPHYTTLNAYWSVTENSPLQRKIKRPTWLEENVFKKTKKNNIHTRVTFNTPENYLFLKSALYTWGHGRLHKRTDTVLEMHVVTARGIPENSFKGTLIFQMLSDINKPPNWRAEIQFERSSPWRCRDVYPCSRNFPAFEASQSTALGIVVFLGDLISQELPHIYISALLINN